MFKIAISLRFIEIINKSWHLLETFGWNLKPLFKKYNDQMDKYQTILMHLFYSETSILSQYSIYNMQTFDLKIMY